LFRATITEISFCNSKIFETVGLIAKNPKNVVYILL